MGEALESASGETEPKESAHDAIIVHDNKNNKVEKWINKINVRDTTNQPKKKKKTKQKTTTKKKTEQNIAIIS